MHLTPSIERQPPITTFIARAPISLFIIGVMALELGLANAATALAGGQLISPVTTSLILLLIAGPLEEGARWAVGAAALQADGMRRAKRRLWGFFSWIVVVEALGAAYAIFRNPPGDLAVCALALVVLRLPPTLAHAGWTWAMLRAISARAGGALTREKVWFGVALVTHVVWDGLTAAIAAIQQRN